MKRVFQESHIKRHQRRRTLDEMSKRRRPPPSPRRPHPIALSRTLEWKLVTAPTNFSVVDNPEQTLRFFDEVEHHLKKKKYKVYLDLSKVTSLTPDALLYMLSRFDFFGVKYRAMVEGNTPQDANCASLFYVSGFYDHVRPRNVIPKQGPSALKITSGHRVEPGQAAIASQFARQFRNQRVSSGVYGTLIECMANTNNHAYTSVGLSNRWWLFAVYDSKIDRVRFSFLDNGLGIARTVNRKLRDIMAPDVDLVKYALQDQLRSRTKLPWRGKGLPKIFSFFKQGRIENLKVVSNKGYIDFNSNTENPLSRPFQGTLLTWDF